MNCKKAFLILVIIFLIFMIASCPDASNGSASNGSKAPLIVKDAFLHLEALDNYATKIAGFQVINSIDSYPDKIFIDVLDKPLSEAFASLKLNKGFENADIYDPDSSNPLDRAAKIKGIIHEIKIKNVASTDTTFVYQHAIVFISDINTVNKCVFRKSTYVTKDKMLTHCIKPNFYSYYSNVNSEYNTKIDKNTCLEQLGKTIAESRINLKTPSDKINSFLSDTEKINHVMFSVSGNRDDLGNCALETTDSGKCTLEYSRGFFAPGITPEMLVAPSQC